MPKHKVQKSNAMMQRMAALEKKIGASLVARSKRHKLNKALVAGKIRAKTHHVAKQPHSGAFGKGWSITLPYREECLGSITSAGAAFTDVAYVLNPGNSTTHPWLAPIASQFEFFKYNKLQFRLESTSAWAVASTNTALGSYLMNTDYDVLDAPFSSQIVMEDYGNKTVTERAPDKTATHVVNHMGKRGGFNGGDRFVLPGSSGSAISVPASSSAHDYGVGLFQIATVGQQASSVIGRLYVGCSVTLSGPLLRQAVTSGVAHFSGTVPTSANNFATAALQSGGSALLGGITLGSNSIVFPAGVPGNYMVIGMIQGATSVAALTSIAASGGASVLNLLTSTTRDATWEILGAASTTGYGTAFMVTIAVAASGGTLTVGPGTIVGGGIGVDLFVVALPASLLALAAPGLSDRLAALESSSSSSSYRGLTAAKLDRMYAKLIELGCIEEDEAPATPGEDGIVRIDHPVGISTSAPPPPAGRNSKLKLLMTQ